jgi:hypothetical protein
MPCAIRTVAQIERKLHSKIRVPVVYLEVGMGGFGGLRKSVNYIFLKSCQETNSIRSATYSIFIWILQIGFRKPAPGWAVDNSN